MFDKYLTKTGRLSCTQPQEVKNQYYILKFQKAHENKYTYTEMVYTGIKELVKIGCPIHGLFLQTPDAHLKGQGCPSCAGVKRKTTEICVQDFQQIHNNLYDYSLVEYTNAHTKVKIRCKIHGVFAQTPSAHLSGQECPKCKNQNQNLLYLVRCNETGLIKIGITTNNVNKRIKSIGGSLTLISVFNTENARKLEADLHLKYKQFKEYNLCVDNGNTEFFNISDDILHEIIKYIEQEICNYES